MKKILTLILAVTALSFAASAQDSNNQTASLQAFAREASPAKVAFTISGKGFDGSNLNALPGTLDFQYPNFRAQAGDNLVLGNDAVIWFYDTKGGEVVIMESFMNDLMANSRLGRNASGQRTVILKQADGSEVVLTIVSIEKVAEEWAPEHFVLDEKSLGNDVIVTDIR